jgi:hypothetical protein
LDLNAKSPDRYQGISKGTGKLAFLYSLLVHFWSAYVRRESRQLGAILCDLQHLRVCSLTT